MFLIFQIELNGARLCMFINLTLNIKQSNLLCIIVYAKVKCVCVFSQNYCTITK